MAGYAVGLDMTIRGTEDRSFRKSVDTYAVVGPWLTTRDEVPDPGDLLPAEIERVGAFDIRVTTEYN